jgi:hypothetical protein
MIHFEDNTIWLLFLAITLLAILCLSIMYYNLVYLPKKGKEKAALFYKIVQDLMAVKTLEDVNRIYVMHFKYCIMCEDGVKDPNVEYLAKELLLKRAEMLKKEIKDQV